MNDPINKIILKDLYNNIKDIQDFPTKGVLFKDILPLIMDDRLRGNLIHMLSKTVPSDVTCIVAPESRGFLLGILLADELNIKFVPIRKPGKLPGEVRVKSYDTEYSSDTLEMQVGVLDEKDICWFIDDVFATGGTYHAVECLVNAEAHLVGGTVLLDIFDNRNVYVTELFEGIKGETNDEDRN